MGVERHPVRGGTSSRGSPESGGGWVSATFTATFVGGVAPFNYSWQFGDRGSSFLASPSHTYVSAGVFDVNLTVSDDAEHSLRVSFNLTVIGPTPLAANFTYHVNYATCEVDGGVTNSVTVNGTARGGDPPYNYSWTLPTGTAYGRVVNTTLTYGGNNTVSVSVVDSRGDTAKFAVAPIMQLPPCPIPVRSSGGSASFTNWIEYGLTGVALALGVAVVVLLIRRRSTR